MDTPSRIPAAPPSSRREGARAPEDRVASLAPSNVRRVRGYIAEHLVGTLKMSAVVAITRLSKSHFSRAFKGTFGQTFSSYVIERRLEHARRLMLTTDAPLSAIAAASGFCDQSHLNRRFRRAVGVAPQTWRRVEARRSLADSTVAARPSP